jgi:hypothetical protein
MPEHSGNDSSNPLKAIFDAGSEVAGKAIGAMLDPFGTDGGCESTGVNVDDGTEYRHDEGTAHYVGDDSDNTHDAGYDDDDGSDDDNNYDQHDNRSYNHADLGELHKDYQGTYSKAPSVGVSLHSSTPSYGASAYEDSSSRSNKGIRTVAVLVLLGGGLVAVIAVVRAFVNSSEKSASLPTSITVTSTVKPTRVSRGRTSNEKVHEFDLPANQWVETSLLIRPNQEVLVHHFASSEAVTVTLGGTTFPRLQTAGTVIPLYTSKNCSSDTGVKARVRYFCVQLNQPESIKLFASNSVKIGVLVKDR